MAAIVSFFQTAFISCSEWFTLLLDKSGMKLMYLAFVFLVLAIRLLLSPVLGGSMGGSAGSDIVRHVKTKW